MEADEVKRVRRALELQDKGNAAVSLLAQLTYN